ncbi:MAG: peptide-methionine (R)-S-oxide reductase MsrB [Pseudomonadota bacterium]
MDQFFTRRALLATATASAAIAATPLASASGNFEVTRTEAEWKAMLTPLQYKVMRREGTERPFSSPLDKNYADGTYHCRGCDLAVYASDHKFDSGTGWPSFYQAIDKGAVGTSTDYKIGYPRTEVHCADCGGHLGHIFGDGPAPTGKSHCINGLAMDFIPA